MVNVFPAYVLLSSLLALLVDAADSFNKMEATNPDVFTFLDYE